MKPFFVILGVLLAGYVARSPIAGSVYAKSGPWGRTYLRADAPTHYWSTIAVYVLLSVALIFWF